MIAAREAAAGAAGSSSDVKLDVNAYGAKRDSSSEEESDVPDAPPEMVPQEVVLDQDLEQLYLSEAKKCLKKWRDLPIDWRKEYPAHKFPAVPEPLDTVDDLMDLDMGPLYKKIINSDPEGRLYGLIPLIASSSPYQIGSLNAESYCERVLRAAGHILTEGNTLLPDHKLEKLTILRMNRNFMIHMRKHYKHVITDTLARQFGMTIVNPPGE